MSFGGMRRVDLKEMITEKNEFIQNYGSNKPIQSGRSVWAPDQ